MRQTTIVAVLDTAPRPADVLQAAGDAHWLELRADAAGELDADWLRARFDGPLLYSLRGHGPSRVQKLLRAAQHFDFIDLDVADLSDEILRAIPPAKRVLSAEFGAASVAELRHAAAGMTAIPARLYRLTTRAARSGEELAPLQLLAELQRDDVTAFATGPTGLWTRILAPWLGARVVFGNIAGDDAPSGTPSVARLIDSFGFPSLRPVDELYGMVGDPVMHSLSPRIHNTAFRALGRTGLYLPFHAPDFDLFWTRVVTSGALERLGFQLRGLSVVSPHKTNALGAAKFKSSIVQRAVSTNLFHKEGDDWFAESTDAHGVMRTLLDHGVHVRNRRVAVVGCGGSGRAMAAALHDAGAEVTLVNRSPERGSLAKGVLHLPFVLLSSFNCDGYSLVVNATPVGRAGEELPFPVEKLSRDAVLVDLVYRDTPTLLITRTRGPGRITIDGWDMLMAQARHQFELMTGSEMPAELIRQTLGFEPAVAVAE